MVEMMLVYLPLFLGAYMILSLLKLPDFSLESSFLGGALAAYFSEGLPLPFLLAAPLLGGAFVGAAVFIFHQILSLPYLPVTIAVNGLFHGLGQYLMKTSFAPFHLPFEAAPFAFYISMGIALCVGCLLYSQVGYCLAIYGGNSAYFSHHGISEKYIFAVGLLGGHACAGMSGFLFACTNGFVDLSMQAGVMLICLAALVLGKLFFRKAQPSLTPPVMGAIAYFLLQQALLEMGLDLRYFNAFQAFAFLAALLTNRQKIGI